MNEPRPAGPDDAPLVRLVDASLPFRAVSRAGERIVAAWRSSASAAFIATWLAIPLDRRVRLVAIVLMVAVLTHLTLTGFAAPEPTRWARAIWIAVLLAVLAIGVCSRGVAAAWTDWTMRRKPYERGNA